jgi:hypothetical protein
VFPTSTSTALTPATGSGGRYVRPLGMTRPTPLVLAEAGAAGYRLVVAFDVDPRDDTDPGADAVTARVTAGLGPGSIVSLHTSHAGTIAALDPHPGHSPRPRAATGAPAPAPGRHAERSLTSPTTSL